MPLEEVSFLDGIGISLPVPLRYDINDLPGISGSLIPESEEKKKEGF